MKKILIVDDFPTMLMSMEGVLKKAGFEVTTAPSGEKAFDLLQSGLKIDLMITDYHMGAMDGITLIRSARKLPAARFAPILMLTTDLSTGQAQRGQGSRGDGVAGQTGRRQILDQGR